MRYLVTGAAGFIGYHVCRRLLESGHEVTGVDGMTPYYDVSLKKRRIDHLPQTGRFTFIETMLENHASVEAMFAERRPDMVIHLAAQAGVRYSIDNPRAYIESNVVGTFNVLEACRHFPVKHLMLASTSSAYGANEKYPFEEKDLSVHPLSLYAATKVSTEMMAHCYAHLFGVRTTAFRFFTVYGPWGRPDMAPFIFTRRIIEEQPIELFNFGISYRDFTYIDDLVEAIQRLCAVTPSLPSERDGSRLPPSDTLSPVAPYRLVNIGGGQPVKLSDFVDEIEKAVGVPAIRVLKPLPPGDVERTYASADLLEHLIGYKPDTPISVGVSAFVDWYRAHMC